MIHGSKTSSINFHELFIKMWTWIGEETLKQKRCLSKRDYFNNEDILEKDIPTDLCYACEDAFIKQMKDTKKSDKLRCDYCSLSRDICRCDDSIYDKWQVACEYNDYEGASKYALLIANAEWI